MGIRIDTEHHTPDMCGLGLVDLPLPRTSAGHLAIDMLEHWPTPGLLYAVDEDEFTDADEAFVVIMHLQLFVKLNFF